MGFEQSLYTTVTCHFRKMNLLLVRKMRLAIMRPVGRLLHSSTKEKAVAQARVVEKVRSAQILDVS